MVIVVGKGESSGGAEVLLRELGKAYKIIDGDFVGDFRPEEVEYAIISPGIPTRAPIVKKLKDTNIKIISEIEFAYLNSPAQIVAVTGTNGKSTTTALIHHILQESGYSSELLGNFGTAFSRRAAFLKSSDVVSLEVSSFQLQNIENFRPHIALLLNIAPDHLDYHGSMTDYLNAKLRITINQVESDHLILSADSIPCKYLRKLDSRANIVFFSTESRVNGAYLASGSIFFGNEFIMNTSEVSLLGRHNLANVLAAVAATRLFGVGVSDISSAVKTFHPLPHRMEMVRSHLGRKYYNDSKATNIDAALLDVGALQGDTVMLVGGSDKGYGFDSLFAGLNKNVVGVIAFGVTAGKIVASGTSMGFENIVRVDTLEEALMASRDIDCENVILAPACASFDQYNNYIERGEDFRRIVNGWEDGD